ncbi:MAG: DAK2 domain-containing protein, partial [Lachnospiraceae bacterium]|nr:DAK2 domain-containing protein [Lachnospiraceae bacterium]
KELGFITVCAGDGLTELMKELGADYIIGGGQTMNPSTEDFLSAIRRVNAKNVFLFPNNVNILMAAEQAAKMTEDRHVEVIPTKTVMEGISALVSLLPGASLEENREAMESARAGVRTIEVTYAIRDTCIQDTEIHTGDLMALSGKDILSCGQDIRPVVEEAVAKAVTDETAVVTLYYGEDVLGSDAEALGDIIQEEFPDLEVDVTRGGQPVYYYLISVE